MNWKKRVRKERFDKEILCWKNEKLYSRRIKASANTQPQHYFKV